MSCTFIMALVPPNLAEELVKLRLIYPRRRKVGRSIGGFSGRLSRLGQVGLQRCPKALGKGLNSGASVDSTAVAPDYLKLTVPNQATTSSR